MTLKIRIQVPKNNGPYEAKVTIGTTDHYLEPGEEIETYLYDGQQVHVAEMAAGSKAHWAEWAARPVLTDADAAADLAGTQRPDNPTAEAVDFLASVKACDLAGDAPSCEACQ